MIFYGSWNMNPTAELFKHLKLYKADLIGKDDQGCFLPQHPPTVNVGSVRLKALIVAKNLAG
jgi:hypothetical protein